MAVDYAVEPVLGESFAHFMTVHFEGTMDALSHLMGSGQLSSAGSEGDYEELLAASYYHDPSLRRHALSH